MDSTLILSNFLNPPILFFILGLLACWVGSDLEIPQPLPKLFSLYLLLAIGFKGGVELSKSGLTAEVAGTLGAALLLAIIVPGWTFFVLRRRMDINNAAAVAATYGSVSAVTFIAAMSFLNTLNISYGGHLVAAMALMESPAIIVGIALARWLGQPQGASFSWLHLLRDAFANGSVLVLCGALTIGVITGEKGGESLAPFTTGLFQGVLCLFLLDMGLASARRLASIRQLGLFPVAFATLVPLVNAALGLSFAHWLGLGQGDALLLVVLAASASYIAVPAAMRLAIPAANPGIYVTMALALTFPFNIVFGLPIYLSVINYLWNTHP